MFALLSGEKKLCHPLEHSFEIVGLRHKFKSMWKWNIQSYAHLNKNLTAEYALLDWTVALSDKETSSEVKNDGRKCTKLE